MIDTGLQRLGAWALQALGRDPFGLQIQVGRSILAVGTMTTLASNPASVLFHSGTAPRDSAVNCVDIGNIGAFCVAGSDALDSTRLILLAFCIPTLVGFVPAVGGWLHAYAAFSLSNNAIGIEGGDQLTVNLAILLACASLVDRRRWGFREKRIPGRRTLFIPANIILVSLVIQIAYVYVEAALVKLNHPIWAEGTALWYWVQNSGFGVSRDGEAVLLDLLSNPAISAAATWGTLVLETALAVGILLGRRSLRIRLGVLVTGIAFHLAIAALMGLVTFAVAMTGALALACWRPRDGYPLAMFKRLYKPSSRGPSSPFSSIEGTLNHAS